LEVIVTDLKMLYENESAKVASILNKYRMENGKNPL